jgi:hypothetical protein
MRFPRQLRLVLTTKSLRFGAYFLRASFRRGRYLAPLIAQNIAAGRYTRGYADGLMFDQEAAAPDFAAPVAFTSPSGIPT